MNTQTQNKEGIKMETIKELNEIDKYRTMYIDYKISWDEYCEHLKRIRGEN